MQTHHDHCPEAEIPVEVEDGFHDYDEVCTACDIDRIAKEGAPDCLTPVCDDNSGNDAYASLIEAGCGTDCSSDACRDLFFILSAVHNQCDHDTLSRASEEGLHDLEVTCANHVCNIVDGVNNQLVCDEDHGKRLLLILIN